MQDSGSSQDIDGTSSDSDAVECTAKAHLSNESSLCASCKNSGVWEHGRQLLTTSSSATDADTRSASVTSIASITSYHSLSRRITTTNIPKSNLADSNKPLDEDLPGEELSPNITVRFHEPLVQGTSTSTGGSGGIPFRGSHAQQHHLGALTAPAAAWAESSPGSALSPNAGRSSYTYPNDADAQQYGGCALPSHISDAGVRAAFSPHPGSALATLLATSSPTGRSPRTRRVPGDGLQSLRSWSPAPKTTIGDSGNGGGGDTWRGTPRNVASMPQRSLIYTAVSASSATDPFLQSQFPPCMSCLPTPSAWTSPPQPQPSTFSLSSSSSAQHSSVNSLTNGLQQQRQQLQQQPQAAAAPPSSQITLALTSSTSTLPLIAPPVTPSVLRTSNSSPVPSSPSCVSPSVLGEQGVQAGLWRLTSPAASRDPRVSFVGTHHSAAGSPWPVSSSLSGSSWRLSQHSSSRLKAAGDELLTVSRSGAGFSARYRQQQAGLQQPRQQLQSLKSGACTSTGRTGPLLRPVPRQREPAEVSGGIAAALDLTVASGMSNLQSQLQMQSESESQLQMQSQQPSTQRLSVQHQQPLALRSLNMPCSPVCDSAPQQQQEATQQSQAQPQSQTQLQPHVQQAALEPSSPDQQLQAPAQPQPLSPLFHNQQQERMWEQQEQQDQQARVNGCMESCREGSNLS